MKTSAIQPVAERPNEDVSMAVVDAVADATGADPLELPPLCDVVDPDAVDSLVQADRPAAERSLLEIRFSVAGCEVVVDSGGNVTATPGGDRD